MGQKVSPVGLRIGVNKPWESVWYADKKNFAKYLKNDNEIRKFLEKKKLVMDASVIFNQLSGKEKRLKDNRKLSINTA